jgi:anti-sigma regulatory factor (Ser/Thr protein kinase)
MKIKFQLDAVLEQLEPLCKAVETLQQSLMCTDKQMFEVTIVLEEVCANVIRHSGAKFIEVELCKDWDVLVITVTDDGVLFDPTQTPEADIKLPLEKRVPGGLGIHLVHHYTDSFVYSRENDKNVVTLTKRM